MNEGDVSAYMRSVVRTIVQCHDENEPHAGVEPNKFMLLTEDRQSPVKATGFGRPGGTVARLERIPGSLRCPARGSLSPPMQCRTV